MIQFGGYFSDGLTPLSRDAPFQVSNMFFSGEFLKLRRTIQF